jgi:hypothetical protein
MPKRIVTIEVSRYLGTPRLTPYLMEANGDLGIALALYQWNVQLASAFQEVLAVVEVVTRNAIDEQLRIWNTTRVNRQGAAYAPEWALAPAPPLAGLLRDALGSAMGQAQKAQATRDPAHPRKHDPICHDDVVAQLSFNIWRKLLPEADPTSVAPQPVEQCSGTCFPPCQRELGQLYHHNSRHDADS